MSTSPESEVAREAAQEFVPKHAALAEDAPDVPSPRGDTVPTLTPQELDELVGSLSVSARKALGVADALRRERSLDKVHMEHLLVGTYVEHGGHQHYAFDERGVSPGQLTQLLTEFELRLAERREGESAATPGLHAPVADPVDAMPPLSAHAERALAAAAFLAGWQPGAERKPGRVQARHLLAGMLAIGECRVIQALAPVRDALVATVRARIAGEKVPDAPAQLRTLDTLFPTTAQPAANAPDTPPAPARPASPTSPSPLERHMGSGHGAANDRPDRAVDRLNFTDYVEAFANLIESGSTEPPLTIGIYGSWGAGKSFLLHKLRAELESRAKDAGEGRMRVRCVEFNAWRYNAADRIWPRLVRTVLGALDDAPAAVPDEGWAARTATSVRRAARRLRGNIGRQLRAQWKGIVGWLLLGGLVGVVVALLPAAHATGLLRALLEIDDAKTLTVATIVGALIGVVRTVHASVVSPLGGWVTALFEDEGTSAAKMDQLDEVEKDLALLEQRLAKQNARVLLTVDDLDRCEPEKAIEVLQAVNLLLARQRVVVVLGIDARIITAAVERHYKDLLGPAGMSGYEYLDKIVQIPFRIPDPTPGEIANLLEQELARQRKSGTVTVVAATTGGATDGATAAQTDPAQVGRYDRRRIERTPEELAALPFAERVREGIAGLGEKAGDAVAEAITDVATRARQEQQEKEQQEREGATPARPPATPRNAPLAFTQNEVDAFRAVAPYLRPNVRHIKRLVNVYALVRSLADRRGEQQILADPAATICWLALCAQWPYTARAMLAEFDALELQRHLAGAQWSAPTEAPLRHLLRRASGKLDTAFQRRFDHDARVLASVVDASDHLAWDEIRALRRYTLNFNPALDGEVKVEESRASD